MTQLIQGFGQWQAGQMAANISRQNAMVADANAQNAAEVGAANEEAVRRKNAALLGDKRASLLDSGIGVVGSGTDLLQSSAQNLEMDALNTRYEGILKTRAYKTQADNLRQTADMQEAGARTSLWGGIIGTGASLLTGGSGGGGITPMMGG